MQTHYVLLLSSFKEQLQQHVRVHAMEAVMACWELEQSLQSLTGDIIVYSIFLFCQFRFLFYFIPLVACLSFVSSCKLETLKVKGLDHMSIYTVSLLFPLIGLLVFIPLMLILHQLLYQDTICLQLHDNQPYVILMIPLL